MAKSRRNSDRGHPTFRRKPMKAKSITPITTAALFALVIAQATAHGEDRIRSIPRGGAPQRWSAAPARSTVRRSAPPARRAPLTVPQGTSSFAPAPPPYPVQKPAMGRPLQGVQVYWPGGGVRIGRQMPGFGNSPSGFQPVPPQRPNTGWWTPGFSPAPPMPRNGRLGGQIWIQGSSPFGGSFGMQFPRRF